MEIDDKIRDETLQYDINKKAAIISALSWCKINEYEYLTGEKVLPFDQSRIIEQAKSIYPPLGKILEKQKKQLKSKEKTSWKF